MKFIAISGPGEMPSPMMMDQTSGSLEDEGAVRELDEGLERAYRETIC